IGRQRGQLTAGLVQGVELLPLLNQGSEKILRLHQGAQIVEQGGVGRVDDEGVEVLVAKLIECAGPGIGANDVSVQAAAVQPVGAGQAGVTEDQNAWSIRHEEDASAGCTGSDGSRRL